MVLVSLFQIFAPPRRKNGVALPSFSPSECNKSFVKSCFDLKIFFQHNLPYRITSSDECRGLVSISHSLESLLLMYVWLLFFALQGVVSSVVSSQFVGSWTNVLC